MTPLERAIVIADTYAHTPEQNRWLRSAIEDSIREAIREERPVQENLVSGKNYTEETLRLLFALLLRKTGEPFEILDIDAIVNPHVVLCSTSTPTGWRFWVQDTSKQKESV